MACNECNQNTEQNGESCNCPSKDMSTDCSTYTGDDLSCSGIKKNTILTKVIADLDAFICNVRTEIIRYTALVNIGTGAKIYKGINELGKKEIRTIVSSNINLIDVEEAETTVNISAGIPSLQLESGMLSLIVTTLAGATSFGQISLSDYTQDTFVQSASFDPNTLDITITRNNSEDNIVIPLDFLRNHISSGSYANNIIALTLLDGSIVNVNLNQLVSELLTAAATDATTKANTAQSAAASDATTKANAAESAAIIAAAAAQIQSDYLENNTASKAYIINRNPSKTVLLGVSGSYSISDGDNNYIIEIDNGTNNVTVSASAVTLGTSFFVGLIQKGTGTVTIAGVDIVPEQLTNVIFGQGHTCAIEAINNTKYLIGTLKFA